MEKYIYNFFFLFFFSTQVKCSSARICTAYCVCIIRTRIICSRDRLSDWSTEQLRSGGQPKAFSGACFDGHRVLRLQEYECTRTILHIRRGLGNPQKCLVQWDNRTPRNANWKMYITSFTFLLRDKTSNANSRARVGL